MSQTLYYIDYGNKNSLPVRFPGQIIVIEFDTDIITTISKITPATDTIWIASSICDYSNFEFNIELAEPERKQLVDIVTYFFSSDTQELGDTFVLRSMALEHLKDRKTIAFNGFLKKVELEKSTITRLAEPFVEHDYDTHAQAILEHDFIFPYSTFRAVGHPDVDPTTTPCLWERRFKETTVTTTGATQITVLKDAKQDIVDEVWQYHGTIFAKEPASSSSLDIVFYSNGEPAAEANWQRLLELTKDQPNRVVRVDGVEGRVASQRAAARAATTNWYFLVNAKLEVDEDFDWSWQPDRMQAPKHYIFRARNPVNGLEYGHMATVCNNRALTLATMTTGLDFTMESPVAVVDIVSGTARYNTDSWTTWRTAFRESIKLYNQWMTQQNQESKDRLDVWIENGTGDYEVYSKQGALDGIRYWETVEGDMEQLLLTYDWAYIRTIYDRTVF